jgi:hypothetical protein
MASIKELLKIAREAVKVPDIENGHYIGECSVSELGMFVQNIPELNKDLQIRVLFARSMLSPTSIWGECDLIIHPFLEQRITQKVLAQFMVDGTVRLRLVREEWTEGMSEYIKGAIREQRRVQTLMGQ